MWMVDKELFLERMFYEWERECRVGLYHDTQILMAYNSNRMEGNPLTENDTRGLFETESFTASSPDAQAISNHFLAFNEMLLSVDEELNADYIKRLHAILMEGTRDSFEPDFILGEWREVPVFAGVKPFLNPRNIDTEINALLDSYNSSYVDFAAINRFMVSLRISIRFSTGMDASGD